MIIIFTNIPVSNFWLDNMNDFFRWCEIERKKCVPKGACGQSMSTVDGTVGFHNKYPTFEDAYNEYMKQFNRGDEI